MAKLESTVSVSPGLLLVIIVRNRPVAPVDVMLPGWHVDPEDRAPVSAESAALTPEKQVADIPSRDPPTGVAVNVILLLTLGDPTT